MTLTPEEKVITIAALQQAIDSMLRGKTKAIQDGRTGLAIAIQSEADKIVAVQAKIKLDK